MKRTVIAALLLASLAATVAAQPRPPFPPVPPPRAEVVPPSRGGRTVWQPGHWRWTGRSYVWVAGRWVTRGPQFAQYVPGRWVWTRGAWVWRPAHWR